MSLGPRTLTTLRPHAHVCCHSWRRPVTGQFGGIDNVHHRQSLPAHMHSRRTMLTTSPARRARAWWSANAVAGLRESLYDAVQNCRVEAVEFYPIDPTAGDVNPRDMYLSLRARSPVYTQRLSKDTLATMFHFAVDHHREMPLLPQLILDDILVMITWDPEARELLEMALQQLAYRPFNVLPKTKILDIWDRLRDDRMDNTVPMRDVKVLLLICVSIVETERYDQSAIAFIRAAHSLLFTRSDFLEQETLMEPRPNPAPIAVEDDVEGDPEVPAVSPGEADALERPSFIRTALQLIHQLTTRSESELALDVFKHLVSEGYIPEGSMVQQTEKVLSEADGAPSISSAEHFTFVIVGTLVKTCLHFGFYDLAYEFMQSMKSKALFDPVYRAAVTRVTETLLLSGTEKDAELLAGLVTAWAQDTAEIPSLSDEIIWLVYDFCVHVVRPDLAVFVYERLSTPQLEDIYPLPQGHALSVLLTRLNHENRHTDGRKVVRNLLQHNYRIDPMHRAEVIYQASRMGAASEARALYEKYERRAKNASILGSAKLATELVAHFVRISDDKMANDEKPAARDARKFATKVVSNFVASKGALANEPRATINAIAHCYFLLGELSAGFRALRVILARQEKPDPNDVNVLLAAAAKYSPRVATDMLSSALKDNYKAGARAYATLLHYAQKFKDSDLASEVIQLAAEEGESHNLDPASRDSMIRASLTPFLDRDVADKSKAYPALRTALATMRFNRQHGIKVDDPLVLLGIRAGIASGHLFEAFDFWHDFFLDRIPDEKDPWFWAESQLLIAIEKAVMKGRMPWVTGSALLGRLKAGGLTNGIIRNRDGTTREIMPFATPRPPSLRAQSRTGSDQQDGDTAMGEERAEERVDEAEDDL
ncbi:hypothetical protein CALCODRAFT_519829 [Calocera cornea HHB12733]|uniref:Uncharacterized protein n=1 Tax=Calocera cornea HHB12733 TaxID=1353952 RepID=A0A165DZW8_9BASI|nr:hypothetical protein CALCODRAFT_519829 [Calocera cornea HHB12733]